MSAREQARKIIEREAVRDFERGLPPNSLRHYNKAGSQGADWYNAKYAELVNETEPNT